jgi:hypothetical protein
MSILLFSRKNWPEMEKCRSWCRRTEMQKKSATEIFCYTVKAKLLEERFYKYPASACNVYKWEHVRTGISGIEMSWKTKRKLAHGRERTLRHVLIQLGSNGLNWPGEVRVIELAEGMVLPCGIIASFDECLLGTRDRVVLYEKELWKYI